MTRTPPAPIMSRNDPTRPTHSKPGGSKIPDIVLVIDQTKPPTQDNIKKVIEIKFPGDKPIRDQMRDYGVIAGGAPVETWTLDRCGCGEEEPEPKPKPAPAPDPAGLLVVLALLALVLLDDLIPVAGAADDPAIPVLLARLAQILAR